MQVSWEGDDLSETQSFLKIEDFLMDNKLLLTRLQFRTFNLTKVYVMSDNFVQRKNIRSAISGE